jgi:hypothetical protein
MNHWRKKHTEENHVAKFAARLEAKVYHLNDNEPERKAA